MRDKYAWWQLFEHIEAIAHFVWQSTKTSRLVFFLLLINDEVQTTANARCLLNEGGNNGIIRCIYTIIYTAT